jgi:hypothetical protein
MKNLIWLPLLFLVSCDKVEVGPEMTESAQVIDILYRPGQTTTASGHSFDWTGDGGFTTHSTTIETKDKYAVAFKCQHGKFVIEDDGKGTRAERLWKTLEKGDKVEITYKERRRNGEIEKYEFIDAQKR